MRVPASTPPRQHVSPMRQVEPSTKKAATATEDDEDDDIDLFGSDEEDDKEATRLREERLRQYAEKKAKKPALVAKSSILLDVKPVSGPSLTPPPPPAVLVASESQVRNPGLRTDTGRAGVNASGSQGPEKRALLCCGVAPRCHRLLPQPLFPSVPSGMTRRTWPNWRPACAQSSWTG